MSAHGRALDAVFEAFVGDGEWPDPVQLQRQQRAAGGHPSVARALAEMPLALGWRDYAPPRIRLSLFGIACCAGSGPLLSGYFELLRLALQRHSEPASVNGLRRSDVDELLPDPGGARLLSRVILDDCPFLGSGSGGLDAWDREIDERVVEYEHCDNIEQFLAVLAEQRGLAVAPHGLVVARSEPAGPLLAGSSGPVLWDSSAEPRITPARLARAAAALLFVVSLGGLILAIAGPSLPASLAVIAASAAGFALPLWRPNFPLAPLIAAVMAAALLGAGVGTLLSEERPRPVSEQLDTVLAQAADRGSYPAVRRVLRLHQQASRSHLLILRDASERPGGIPRELALPPSDELRVYDEVRGRLVLRLAFRPQNPGEVRQGPDGDFPGYRMQVAPVGDVDRDGNVEVLVLFERRSNASGPLPVPALLWRDAVRGEYRLDPLLTESPALSRAPGLAAAALDGYRQPSTLRDQLSETRLAGYPADVVAIRQALRGPVLLTGFAEMSDQGFTGRYEAVGWFLSLDGGRLQLTRCTPRRRHLFVTPSTPAEAENAIGNKVIDPARGSGCARP